MCVCSRMLRACVCVRARVGVCAIICMRACGGARAEGVHGTGDATTAGCKPLER